MQDPGSGVTQKELDLGSMNAQNYLDLGNRDTQNDLDLICTGAVVCKQEQ